MVSLDALLQREKAVAVVGLGYVGLPLAVALSPYFQVIGFDVAKGRIVELQRGRDRTGEVEPEALVAASIRYTYDPADLADATVIIVAVPTPIDAHRRPDLGHVRSASATVGKHMAKGAVVVFESTVYPGLTEEICIPILEEHSGLTCGKDFWVGYSPERINPGDKLHTLQSVVKVVAGQNRETTELLAGLYGVVVKAGIHKASSIKVAEAAKVIENTQRDLNIALMNELALIFNRMGVDTHEVLEAAGTKWNFLPFRPGLVGGHCIGVDPYYLTFKAEALGFHPQVILAGRRINDFMGKYVAETVIKTLNNSGRKIYGARVGVLGLTFKENVPDLRNTRVIDVIHELEEYRVEVLVHDPIADHDEALEEYGIDLAPLDRLAQLDAIVVAVSHKKFESFTPREMLGWCADPANALLFDVKSLYQPEAMRLAGFTYWRL
jgi:UDP-N-acetyl-D-galactosamine dehydrogenase